MCGAGGGSHGRAGEQARAPRPSSLSSFPQLRLSARRACAQSHGAAHIYAKLALLGRQQLARRRRVAKAARCVLAEPIGRVRDAREPHERLVALSPQLAMLRPQLAARCPQPLALRPQLCALLLY